MAVENAREHVHNSRARIVDAASGSPKELLPARPHVISAGAGDQRGNPAAIAASPISRDNTPTMVGHIDGLDPSLRLTGWIWSEDKAHRSGEVSVYEGDRLLAVGQNDFFRGDLQLAGYGDGRCGFALAMPDEIFDGKVHQLSIRYRSARDREPVVYRTEQLFPAREAPKPVSDPRRLAPETSVYVPGQRILCRKSFGAVPYHQDGWSEPEETQTWIEGAEASIGLLLRRPSEFYTLELAVAPAEGCTVVPTLEVFFNYFRVGFAEVPAARLVSVCLPAETFILRKAVITLHCREATKRGFAVGPLGKARALSVRHWTIL